MSTAFEFTAENRAKFDEIVARYPWRRAAMLPALHLAQEQQGHISSEVEDYVAELLNLPAVDVHKVVTFYTLFRRRPVGRHQIRLCACLSCWVRGAERMSRHLEERLGVPSGGTTQDGEFTWEAVSDCLGACELAPMLQLDKDFYGPVTAEAIDELLETTKGKPPLD